MLAISFQLSDITFSVVLGGVMIAIARVFDVSLGVLRHAAQAAGRRKQAWVIAFFEALIWVFVVSSVIDNLDNPVYAFFYALGFATGSFVGITLEGILARGEQVVRIFTHHGDAMSAKFRELGYRVTQFEGKGRDGPIQLLFIHVPRKKAPRLRPVAREIDESCFIVVDDVRSSSSRAFDQQMVRK